MDINVDGLELISNATCNIDTCGSKVYDKFYVINLDRSVDRWNQVKRTLDTAEVIYERFAGVDGFNVIIKPENSDNQFTGHELASTIRKLDPKLRYKINCNNSVIDPLTINVGYRDFSAGELGLWCSYVLVWQDALKNHYNNIIIAEDDLYILDKANFNKDIANFFYSLPKTYDIGLLNSRTNRGQVVYFNEFSNSVSDDYIGFGIECVFYSLQAIEKLTSVEYYNSVVDSFFWRYKKRAYILTQKMIIN